MFHKWEAFTQSKQFQWEQSYKLKCKDKFLKTYNGDNDPNEILIIDKQDMQDDIFIM